MKFIIIFIVALCVFSEKSNAEKIKVFCDLKYLSCPENCNNFEPKWLFKLKSKYGGNTITYDLEIDESNNEANIMGASYSIGSKNYNSVSNNNSMQRYVDTYISPNAINLNLYLNGVLKSKISVNRISGKFVREELHTDGSIEKIKIGEPYSKYFGYCSKKYKREF